MKRALSIILCLCLVIQTAIPNVVHAEQKKEDTNVNISAASAVLLEGSTGEIIYEKDKDKELPPASITKIMTLILIFEAVHAGKITLKDEVSVSEHAASMGGSQVFLEPGETQDVNTMIKCISIASANDACVAMAEYIAGSEEEFVTQMNEKAKSLGMKNTNFVNCCGLDVDNHYSTAYDVALMSRELITKYPEISKYSTVWMDTITHVTKKGETEFGLTNTNKLVKSYEGITGLKTGSTSKAKYCLSATAKRNGMDLIAVVMAAPDYKVRFPEAAKLLNYGFANCRLYKDDSKKIKIEPVPVKKGIKSQVEAGTAKSFSYICMKGVKPSDISKKTVINDSVDAPVKQGDKVGEIKYILKKKEIGSVPIIAKESIAKETYKDAVMKIWKQYLIG